MYFAVSIGELDRSFIAGFLEGEATLGITELNAGQSLSCLIGLNQRDDEQDTLEWLLATTGLGSIHRVPARSTSKPQIAWRISSQEDCHELLGLIGTCGFHGHRAAELEIWQQAVHVWTECAGDARRAELRRLKAELAAARRFGRGAPTAKPFASRKQLLGYISGFVCAEGCFGMSGNRPVFSVHLRQDDEPLLRLLAAETGLGRVSSHRPAPPLNPSATWTVSARAQLTELRDLLWAGGLTGRKLREMDAWGAAVDEMCRGVQPGVSPRVSVLATAAARLRDLRAYRSSEGRDLLRLPGRDVRTEALAALAAWARGTPGRLAGTGYTEWRREHPDAPNRDTISREFGSWHRALEAAGLSDRAAASPATVAARNSGGSEGRAARRDVQRERVISAVLRFEREHGRLPRAMEFFRWRLDHAVDAPTQPTMYRCFPGGWADVLDSSRQAAGATV